MYFCQSKNCEFKKQQLDMHFTFPEGRSEGFTKNTFFFVKKCDYYSNFMDTKINISRVNLLGTRASYWTEREQNEWLVALGGRRWIILI